MKKRIVTIISIMLAIACLCLVFAACNEKKPAPKPFLPLSEYVSAAIPTTSDSAIAMNWSYVTDDMTNSAKQEVSEILKAYGLLPNYYYYNLDYLYNSASSYTTDNDVLLKMPKVEKVEREEPGETPNTVIKVIDWKVYCTLYNVVTGKELSTVELTADQKTRFETYSFDHNAWYTISTLDEETGKRSTKLYDANGAVVKITADGQESYQTAADDDPPSVDNVTNDVYRFAKAYFRMDSESFDITFLREFNDMNDVGYDFDNSSDQYYYCYDGGKIMIYDKNLVLLYTYYYDSEGSHDMYILDDGNILVQYIIQEMDESKSFSYIENGKKYTLKTVLVNVEKKCATKKDFKYYVSSLRSNSYLKSENGYCFDERVENVATLYPIEKQRLLKSGNDKMTVNLTNGLKVKERLDQIVDNQIPGTRPYSFQGRFVYDTPEGEILTNGESEVVGLFTYDYDEYTGDALINENFLIKNGRIYDYDLNLLFDYEIEGYQLKKMYNNSIIFSKEEEITAYEDVSNSNGFKFSERTEKEDATSYYRFDPTAKAMIQIAGTSSRLDGAQKLITTTSSYFQTATDNYSEYYVKTVTTTWEIDAETGSIQDTSTTEYAYYNDMGGLLVDQLTSTLTRVASTSAARMYISINTKTVKDTQNNEDITTKYYSFYRFA